MNKKIRFAFASTAVIATLFGSFAIGGLAGKLQIDPLYQPISQIESLLRSIINHARGNGVNQKYVETSLLELKLTELETMPGNQGDNAGFSAIDGGYLIANRSGEIFHIAIQWPAEYYLQRLPYQIPVEKQRFLTHPVTERHPRIPTQFGVKDIFTINKPDGLHIFASHHYWKELEQCAVFRLSTITISHQALFTPQEEDWRTIFESSPCMRLDSRFNRLGEDDTFLQAGGRIAEYDERRLLLTVGDHFLDGIHNTNHVQNPESSYGKIWLVDRVSGEKELFTIGHRNPQGLTRDQYGQWWSSEHGPRGGDEVNLLKSGANYGWPLASYGTLYAGYAYPEGLDWHSHEGFLEPAYTWPKSVAASNLIRLNDSQFSRWGDNLIMASLGGRALLRLEVDGDRILGAERVSIGHRLRDLAQANDGSLLLMSDRATFIRVESAEQVLQTAEENAAAKGRSLWMACGGCHTVGADDPHRIGPNLHGILGRNIAEARDFEYSEALISIGGDWSEERLNHFLADPAAFAPGTSMAFAGIDDPLDRKLLIQYLKKSAK